MSKFGNVAVKATEIYRTGKVKSPTCAWKETVKDVFSSSKSSQEKSCPRGAYLGLCEEGYVRGVPAGDYTRSKSNKDHAISALNILRKSPHLASDTTKLWRKVLNGDSKTHNEQMHVVVALWQSGYIK